MVDSDKKTERATKVKRIMYMHICLYSLLVIGKMWIDYENDLRLEVYRAGCKGVGHYNEFEKNRYE